MGKLMNLLDIIKLGEDLPEHGLQRGEEGTIVELLAPGVFLVEFSDENGRTYAMPEVKASQIDEVVYHHNPTLTAADAQQYGAARQTANANIHVAPSNDGWIVIREGSTHVISSGKSKEKAVATARQIARNTESEVVIHRKDGSIREHRKYSNGTNPLQDKSS